MTVVVRTTATLALLLVLGVPGLAPAEELTQRDTRGPVTVVATLMPPAAAGEPLRVRLALDTHSVGLDTIAFERAVALRQPDGTEVSPTAVEVSGGGHHRRTVVVFPAPAPNTPVTLVVKAVGGVAERVFTWQAVPR